MTKEQLIVYRNWIVYEIYPKSFCDSNGDGIGDLQGIVSKLDYLKSLQVDAVWICPCFPSPQDDNGYDISDYRDIDPMYGSLRDMDELIEKAHATGIKVLLDLVANHTSTYHAWFQQSQKDKINSYADYYYWTDKPLNDWKSIFTGKSVWIYNEQRKQYYLASFAPTQADLNWTNPKVRKEMQEIVDFWVKRGVDGFRCDVLDMISKRFDDPRGNGNGPHLHEYIRELFDRETTRNLFTVGECWLVDAEHIRLFCGMDREELSCIFQFSHRMFGFSPNDSYEKMPYKIKDIAATLSRWQIETQRADILYALFWENHDSPRIVSRFGDENLRYASATMFATMLYLLCGVGFLFQGQELGLTNTNFDNIVDFDDIEARSYYDRHVEQLEKAEIFKRLNDFGRDNARRMMPWRDKKTLSWISTDERQFVYNVETQEKAENSVLNYYRKLLRFRKEKQVFSLGDYREIAITDEYYIYARAYQGKRFTVVCNFEKPSSISGLSGKIVLANLGRKGANGEYAPYECAVIEE